MPKLWYCFGVSSFVRKLIKSSFFRHPFFDKVSFLHRLRWFQIRPRFFLHEDFHGQPRDKFHEEFMKFRETFLTKLSPIQAKRVKWGGGEASEQMVQKTSSMKRVVATLCTFHQLGQPSNVEFSPDLRNRPIENSSRVSQRALYLESSPHNMTVIRSQIRRYYWQIYKYIYYEKSLWK